jgi:hypothetical protein
MKKIDIEKVLYPEANKLVINEDCGKATIIDIELDPIECTFINDGCVQLNTKDYNHLYLSQENLLELINMIEYYEIETESDVQ